MTAKDAFQKLAQHQLDGVTFHQAMTLYAAANGLTDFQMMQAKQAREEFRGLELTYAVYLSHHGALLELQKQTYSPDFIKAEWHERVSQIDKHERADALAAGFQKWLEWEQSTRETYKSLASDESLTDDDRLYIERLLKGVKNELAEIHKLMAKYG